MTFTVYVWQPIQLVMDSQTNNVKYIVGLKEREKNRALFNFHLYVCNTHSRRTTFYAVQKAVGGELQEQE